MANGAVVLMTSIALSIPLAREGFTYMFSRCVTITPSKNRLSVVAFAAPCLDILPAGAEEEEDARGCTVSMDIKKAQAPYHTLYQARDGPKFVMVETTL